jgi:hypothetical protein
MNKSELLKRLPSTLILETHYKPEELNELRKTLESHGCRLTTSVFDAELVITKLTQEKRARREIYELVRTHSSNNASATKNIDVVKEKWVRKCIEENGLVDWPFTDGSTWRIVQVIAIQPITPPKRKYSPEKFAVPGTPPSKQRTLSRSGSMSATQKRPSLVLSPSFESAPSDDPFQTHFLSLSQTSTISSGGEEEKAEKLDYRDHYACRRKSPLISRNETFIKLLFEIKLARELAL